MYVLVVRTTACGLLFQSKNKNKCQKRPSKLKRSTWTPRRITYFLVRTPDFTDKANRLLRGMLSCEGFFSPR